MKIRYLTILLLGAASAGFGLAGCDTGSGTLNPDTEARIRNSLPSSCTQDQISLCKAEPVPVCKPTEELVADWVADCCLRFTCQPICKAAGEQMCDKTPAPLCL